MRFHEYELRDKTEWWIVRNERWQQRLLRSVDKLSASTAPSFIVRPVIDLAVVSITGILRKRINQSTSLAEGAESMTVSPGEKSICPVKRP